MYMEKLSFLVGWGRKKEKSWSGTNYSIYKALKEFYHVNDIDVSIPLMIRGLFRLLRIDGFTSSFYMDSYIKRKVKNTEGKVFQFSELCLNDRNTKTFIYQDLSVSYIKYMYLNLPEIIAYSGFNFVREKIINKRLVQQNEYYRTCSAIFTMGHWLKDFLCSDGIPADKIFAVGGGYNCDVTSIAPVKKSHTKILFIGRDFKRKGGFITYEAFKMLRDRGEEVELYVVGPKQDPIKKHCNGYFFLGEKSQAECETLYNKCDIFCMPSYFEAYGLVFAEALVFGLPCIGRDCYEMPYFIEDGKNGYLLKNDSASELADKIFDLLHNKTIYDYVIDHREFYIREYSWNSVAKRMKAIMDLF